MIYKELVQIGDPRLTQEMRQVMDFKDKKLQALLEELKENLYQHELVGLAANQIGSNYKVFVTEVRKTLYRNPEKTDPFRVFINPVIVSLSKNVNEVFEGCGSVAYSGLFAPVVRPESVTLQAYDENGKSFEYSADGLLARVIQHEIDHLNNIEFVTRVSNWSKAMSSGEYRKLF